MANQPQLSTLNPQLLNFRSGGYFDRPLLRGLIFPFARSFARVSFVAAAAGRFAATGPSPFKASPQCGHRWSSNLRSSSCSHQLPMSSGMPGRHDLLDRAEQRLELGIIFHRRGRQPMRGLSPLGPFIEKVDRRKEQNAVRRARAIPLVNLIGQNPEKRPDTRLEIQFVAFPGIKGRRGLIHNRGRAYPDGPAIAPLSRKLFS